MAPVMAYVDKGNKICNAWILLHKHSYCATWIYWGMYKMVDTFQTKIQVAAFGLKN